MFQTKTVYIEAIITVAYVVVVSDSCNVLFRHRDLFFVIFRRIMCGSSSGGLRQFCLSVMS
jgi:hypothetical protein